ncbi:hypothetical protein TRFO_28255 [Tritrichomonas foetus]|uniref:ATP-grasp domain-containing protein n=1 Tax=Tritrichomonas foetus TaxID=1144522 RepID=A0A1J4JYN1_9EUKA|nr:hypothetical protein TRFO_28255 [Tritrichomonas foetus]|eukprot:OHT04271.1 hypothetical protein TRFO_28255 [Tritrichomonas foetus]
MLVNEGRFLFSVVKKAISSAGLSLQDSNPQSLLVWYDNLREIDYYSTLKPWQVVNRIPNINLICRKAPFVQLVNRMKLFFPTLYTFYPYSIILPNRIEEFKQLVSKHEKKYIIKPDGGSLGCGITILKETDEYKPSNPNSLCVAQEYIESYLIDETKFDLRVYALVASVDPLVIYVYRDGVARFCSEKSSADNVYSQLTNTAVNKNNPNVKMENITRTIKDVFSQLRKDGIDTSLIWAKIDNAIILTVLSALKFLEEGIEKQCKPNGYNRCFHILGFDFILDRDLNPLILEVNYRPSLDADTEAERSMKIKMLGTAMKIGAPLSKLQKKITENVSKFNEAEWDEFFSKLKEDQNLIDKNVFTGLFYKVYPSSNKINQKNYNEVKSIALKCPTNIKPRFKLPVMLKKPQFRLPPVNEVFYDTDSIRKHEQKCEAEAKQNNSPSKNVVKTNNSQHPASSGKSNAPNHPKSPNSNIAVKETINSTSTKKTPPEPTSKIPPPSVAETTATTTATTTTTTTTTKNAKSNPKIVVNKDMKLSINLDSKQDLKINISDQKSKTKIEIKADEIDNNKVEAKLIITEDLNPKTNLEPNLESIIENRIDTKPSAESTTELLVEVKTENKPENQITVIQNEPQINTNQEIHYSPDTIQINNNFRQTASMSRENSKLKVETLLDTSPQVTTGKVDLKQTELKQTEAKQDAVKQTELKQTTTKQTELKQTTTKQTELKQTKAKQTTAKQDAVKQTEAKQDAVKQTKVKQTAGKQTELKQAAAKQTELKQAAAKQTELKHTELKQTEAKQDAVKQTETKQTELKQAAVKQDAVKQTETKQTELKQTKAKQTAGKQTELKHTEFKQTELKQAAAKQTEFKQTELKPMKEIATTNNCIKKEIREKSRKDTRNEELIRDSHVKIKLEAKSEAKLEKKAEIKSENSINEKKSEQTNNIINNITPITDKPSHQTSEIQPSENGSDSKFGSSQRLTKNASRHLTTNQPKNHDSFVQTQKIVYSLNGNRKIIKYGSSKDPEQSISHSNSNTNSDSHSNSTRNSHSNKISSNTISQNTHIKNNNRSTIESTNRSKEVRQKEQFINTNISEEASKVIHQTMKSLALPPTQQGTKRTYKDLNDGVKTEKARRVHTVTESSPRRSKSLAKNSNLVNIKNDSSNAMPSEKDFPPNNNKRYELKQLRERQRIADQRNVMSSNIKPFG